MVGIFPIYREISSEYCTRIREVVKELVKGISESLGLDKCYLEKASQLDSGLQILVANFYPRCPQPELTMGMPPHADHGILTVLIQNDVGGLQVQHNGKWVDVNPLPNSFLVNTGDQLEILSNGKYKSVVHRVVVNSRTPRISVAVPQGPSLNTVVTPAPQLADGKMNVIAFRQLKYKDYLEFQQSNQLSDKSLLDRLKG